MSDKVGPVKLGKDDSEPFLGRDGLSSRNYSEAVAGTIDEEVRSFLDNANREAWEILTRNRGILDDLASRLIEKETLLEDELKEIFEPVQKQPEREVWSYGKEGAVPGAVIGHPVKQTQEPATAPIPEHLEVEGK